MWRNGIGIGFVVVDGNAGRWGNEGICRAPKALKNRVPVDPSYAP